MVARFGSKNLLLIVVLVVCTRLAAANAETESIPIGIIDFYGLHAISADRARAALTFKAGVAISIEGDERPARFAASEARLAKLPGVARARIELVCCDNGSAIAYVGIEERGAKVFSFRAAPHGEAH